MSYLSPKFEKGIWPLFSTSLKKSRSEKMYMHAILEITDFCQKDFLDLNADDVERYITALEFGDLARKDGEHYLESSVFSRLTILRSVSAYITENRLAFDIPEYRTPFWAVDLVQPDMDIRIHDIPSKSEIEELLSKAEGTYMYWIISLAYYCGLATSEIENLSVGDLFITDEKRLAVIAYYGLKKQKFRVVIVPEPFGSQLAEYWVSLPETQTALFVNRLKTPVAARDVQRGLVRLGTKWTMSDIRNAAGCRTLMRTGNETSVADYLGTSERWIHRFEPAARELIFKAQ